MKLPSFLYSWDRFWLHVPVGLVLVGMTWLHPVLGGIYAYLFAAYEKNEDRWLKDQMWRDLAGAMAGMILGSAVWAILILLGGR